MIYIFLKWKNQYREKIITNIIVIILNIWKLK